MELPEILQNDPSLVANAISGQAISPASLTTTTISHAGGVNINGVQVTDYGAVNAAYANISGYLNAYNTLSLLSSYQHGVTFFPVANDGGLKITNAADASLAAVNTGKLLVGVTDGLALKFVGTSADGTADANEGVVLVMTHNGGAGNRQFFLGDSDGGLGIRVIGNRLDSINYKTGGYQDMNLGGNGGAKIYVLDEMRFLLPYKPLPCTVGTVPLATAYPGSYIDVADASSGPGLYRSDGANWKIPNTNTVLS